MDWARFPLTWLDSHLGYAFILLIFLWKFETVILVILNYLYHLGIKVSL